ncbi:hypothetical protein SAMN05443999_102311 [Roseovarius azorensis]|uniref:Uncharacterized protein n=1 Tax=Roseovarius azorensis TaxID=1287727 RepID=A0A1H7K4Y9_9RHOB|nr:hypothetical protein SAMN05443999_102311 [Roseovarius azorensis]
MNTATDITIFWLFFISKHLMTSCTTATIREQRLTLPMCAPSVKRYNRPVWVSAYLSAEAFAVGCQSGFIGLCAWLGRRHNRDICDTKSGFPGVRGLRHLRHLRHGGRSLSLCRSCRRSRRGLPLNFRQLGACITPHRPPLSRCARLRHALHLAPRFQLPATQATHAFRACPALPLPSGFRVRRLALTALHRAP